MNSFFKALLGVVLVTIVAGLGIYWQKSLPSAFAEPVALTADELNLFADKNLGYREKAQLSGDQSARKQFLERL